MGREGGDTKKVVKEGGAVWKGVKGSAKKGGEGSGGKGEGIGEEISSSSSSCLQKKTSSSSSNPHPKKKKKTSSSSSNTNTVDKKRKRRDLEREIGFSLRYSSSAEDTILRIGRRIKETLGTIKEQLKVYFELKIPLSLEAWWVIKKVLSKYILAQKIEIKSGDQERERYSVGSQKRFNRCKLVFGDNFYFYLDML